MILINSTMKDVAELWKEARTLEDWLPNYGAWRARPDIKAILGEQ